MKLIRENKKSDRQKLTSEDGYASTNNLNLLKYKTDDAKKHNLNLVKYSQITVPDGVSAFSFSNRHEIYTILVLLLLIFVTIITISQIIVVHYQNNNAEFSQIKQMQDELRLMDRSIDHMLREKDIYPVTLWYSLKSHEKNLKRFQELIENSSQSKESHQQSLLLKIDNQKCFNTNVFFKQNKNI